MRKLMALALVVGCSGGSEKEPTFSGVQVIDPATLENHVYYFDLTVADTPLKAEEVNDRVGAIPVRLLAGDDFVVAVGLSAELGSSPADRVMGMWKLNRNPPPDGGQEAENGRDDSHTSAGGNVMIVEWDNEVVDIDPEDLDILIDFYPGRL